MMTSIRRHTVSLVLCLPVLACAKDRMGETDTTQSPEPATSLAPAPALTPASRELETPKKLALEVVTASPEGFMVTSTIVSGEKDALLIDAQFTLADAKKVADRVTALNRTLTTVYVTHAHPDHYFGFPAIKERFPNARLVALAETVTEIEKTWQAKVNEWKPMYKDGITSKPIVPEPLAGRSLELEGQKLDIVGAQQGDDASNSYVWIASLKTIVAGDIAYDSVFPWTAETTPEGRKAWSGTLDRLIAMKPERLVPGHQKPEQTQDPASLTFTKEYLAAYDQALLGSKTAAELEQKMKAKYPSAALDVIVKIGAEAAFKKPGAAAVPKASEPKTAEPKSPGAP